MGITVRAGLLEGSAIAIQSTCCACARNRAILVHRLLQCRAIWVELLHPQIISCILDLTVLCFINVRCTELQETCKLPMQTLESQATWRPLVYASFAPHAIVAKRPRSEQDTARIGIQW